MLSPRHIIDFRIAGYCNKRDIVYTRYADDMTFSSDNRDVLKSIYGTIRRILKSEGFLLNERKTMFLSPRCRKRVLGITVNDSLVKAPKEMKRLIRSMIYNSFLSRDYSSRNKVKGYISYINSIEPNYIEKVKKYIKGLYDSEYTVISEIVDAYNQNKYYSDLPDMKVNEIEDVVVVDEIDKDEILSVIYGNYIDFLTSRGIQTDLCIETDHFTSNDSDESQDCPF